MSILPKNTVPNGPKLSWEKTPISFLNTSTPAKIQKPKKVFVEDKVFSLPFVKYRS